MHPNLSYELRRDKNHQRTEVPIRTNKLSRRRCGQAQKQILGSCGPKEQNKEVKHMVYIQSQKDQNWLLPPNIKDMIPDDHICYLVNDFVDNLDYASFDERYEGAGHPAYHPRILTKVLIQGMLDRVRSSRKLGRACKENIVYMFLSELLNPNFRTISDFRQHNKELLKAVFKETVHFAHSLNLVSVEMFCTDGSKIKANAGKKRALKREHFDAIDKWVDEEIEQGIAQDELENKLEEELGLKDKPKITRRDIRRIVQEYRRKLQKNPEKAKEDIKKTHAAVRAQLAREDLKTVNLTDPEARMMQSKKGHYELSYNVQTTVDSKHNIIVANDVCQECTDTHQGKPLIEQSEANLGQLPEGLKVAMDADYDDSPTLKWLEDRKFDAYIPLAEKGGPKRDGNTEFNKKFFVYNEAMDTFTCPQGKILPYKSDYLDKNGQLRKMYYSFKACHYCPVANRCKSPTAENRVITATIYEGAIRRMKAKMELPESKLTYSIRQEVSELTYAHMKHNMGFTEFLMRGLEKVRAEWNLACTASNLRRIFTQLPRNWRQILERTLNSFPQIFCPA